MADLQPESPSTLAHLVSRMLAKRPRERPSLEQVQLVLRPFLPFVPVGLVALRDLVTQMANEIADRLSDPHASGSPSVTP